MADKSVAVRISHMQFPHSIAPFDQRRNAATGVLINKIKLSQD